MKFPLVCLWLWRILQASSKAELMLVPPDPLMLLMANCFANAMLCAVAYTIPALLPCTGCGGGCVVDVGGSGVS